MKDIFVFSQIFVVLTSLFYDKGWFLSLSCPSQLFQLTTCLFAYLSVVISLSLYLLLLYGQFVLV